jgi:hypothetical protein
MIDVLLTSKTPFVFAQASPFAAVPPEYTAAIEASEISLVASWVPQEALLAHRAIGWFVTHGGWNSTQEGVLAKVPQCVLRLFLSISTCSNVSSSGFSTTSRLTSQATPSSCQ